MPRLGDLVGTLMTEFTLARVRADLETVKLVELYRGNSLLQGASLPRFRLPEISVDLPVLIDELDGEGSRSSYERPTPQLVEQAVKEAAATSRVSLSAEDEKDLVASVNQFVERSWTGPESIDRAVSLSRLGAQSTERLLAKKWDAEAGAASATPAPAAQRENAARVRSFVGALEHRLNAKVLGSSGSGPRLMTRAGVKDLREAGDPSLITRISLSFKEDGFEVISVDGADGSELRLVPE